MKKYAIVILAAGQSKRMGQPKQLLPWRGKSIIETVLKEALAVKASDVFVVLGAYRERISEVISKYPVQLIYNKNFKNGIGTSIACASKVIDGYKGVLILPADQVFVTQKVITNIFQQHESSKHSIIMSVYDDGSGPPVFFEKKHFEALKKLTGDKGAKKIIKKNIHEVMNYYFPEGALDVDTETDYLKLKSQS